MITDVNLKKIKQIVGLDNILVNAEMKDYTSFRVGGYVTAICDITSKDIAKELIKYLNTEGINYFVMGNGSNLLVSDQGYNGIIVRFLDKFADINIDVDEEAGRIKAKVLAGAKMIKVGMELAAAGADGFEFATGIPGTIGGAIMMNAGAYGGEMKDIVKSALVIDKDGNEILLSNEELELSYRSSIIDKKGYLVLEVEMEFPIGNKEEILARIKELAGKRQDKQPLDMPSAGSTFKRPEGYYAAALIDEAGLRGFSIGGAMVSTKHTGFVVNKGDATAQDIIDLTDEIKRIVREKSGVSLEMEVRKLGF